MVYITASTAHIATSCSTAEAESVNPVDSLLWQLKLDLTSLQYSKDTRKYGTIWCTVPVGDSAEGRQQEIV